MIWPCSGLFGLYGFENGKRWRHVNFYCQLILKSQKNYEHLDFFTCGLCLAFKNFFGLFSIFLAFRYLEYSKSFKFELFWNNFVIKTIFAENLAKWISVMCQVKVNVGTCEDIDFIKLCHHLQFTWQIVYSVATIVVFNRLMQLYLSDAR